jgi:FAD/FMN-containing dehydrogenase
MSRTTTISTADPLQVLSSTARVVAQLTQVHIDQTAIDRYAASIVNQQLPPPAWDADTHFTTNGPRAIEQVAGWTFALDALNFCFWAQGDNPTNRWRIVSGDTVHDGYMALAIALRDAARAGTPVWDPRWMVRVTDQDLQHIFTPAPGSAIIPLLAHRTRHLNELGEAMREAFPGSTPFTDLITASEGSAPRIAATTIRLAPSFDDVATWTSPVDGETHQVRFHKRAQILASDLAGALEPLGLEIRDWDQLTAFADYKVPQVLRQLGILTYAPDLADHIHRRTLIAAGSREEVEVRAATIWACEWIRQALDTTATPYTASDVDWALWNQGQSLPPDTEPYHRTVTSFY